MAAFAAMVGVPALAAPAGWEMIEPAPAEPAAIAAMPFETPGESFPGSAFYYLADEPYQPLPVAAEIRSDTEEPRPAPASLPANQTREALFTASPFIASGAASDQSRALDCLTQAVYYEAASEPDAGQRAVAQVVLNRVAHSAYPNSVCGVVYQGSQRRTGCQFTFTCDGSLARKPSARFWDRARKVATAALAGAVYRPVGLATHYHTLAVNPYWASSLDQVGVIGAHRFYRWRGSAGRPAAFRSAYAGSEPSARPHIRAAIAELAQSDPAVIAHRNEARTATARPAAPAPTPGYSAPARDPGGEALVTSDRLPQPGSVRPEYAQSGQWIDRP